MHIILKTVLFTGLLGTLMSSVGAAEITLNDGRRFSGDIVSELGAEKLKLKMNNGSIVMYRDFDIEDIQHVTTMHSRQGQFIADLLKRYRELGANATANDVWALALIFKEHNEDIRFRALARDTINKNPQHEGAHKALGHVLHNKQWMTPREKHIAQGHVLFEGQWMTESERTNMLDKRENKRLAQLEEERLAKEILEQKRLDIADALLAKAQAPDKDVPPSGSATPIKRKPVIYLGPVTQYDTSHMPKESCLGK